MADSSQSSSSDLSPMDSFPPDFYHLVPPEISPPDYPSSDPSVLISPPDYPSSDPSVLEFIEFSKNYLASLPFEPSKSKSEELYDFESVPDGEEVDVTAVGCMQYTLKFRAMKVDGHVEMFEVTGQFMGGGNLIIKECTLLK
ncbi:coagulation factor V-like isoform X2 [Ipomoea triloba]|uniref:coagulation factor V-like isoform X2 n=1 Tax=Ipomoea triloba TaxID=35885 RepID=UPI00125DC8A5|nr:coagulation factor V-like isoform X2 [Ipomoea triloba]